MTSTWWPCGAVSTRWPPGSENRRLPARERSMSEQSPVTNREAVLASLLAHACIIILVLMFPDAFKSGGRSLFSAADPNAPIPIAFLRQAPREEPPSVTLGDSGRRKNSEPRPPNAPPPTNADPYSLGNTRNRFVAPPQPEHARPSPRPGTSAPESAPPESDAHLRSGVDGSTEPQGDASQRDDSPGPQFYVPPRGQRSGDENGEKGSSLKEALGRMSMGLSG